ncbi:MAG: c-type cytochrome biogenesis protein CcmI [Gammaproteobacteria bacterium]|nr:c-type cytochrome biogenesis protein CcmI [Gammaproteobacteria bacterium]
MTLFLLAIAGLTLIPLVLIFPALTNRRAVAASSRKEKNIEVARQRIREVSLPDAEETGQAERARDEVRAALLEELAAPAENVRVKLHRRWGWLVLLCIPALALVTYGWVGNPGYVLEEINPQFGFFQDKAPEIDVDALLRELERKIEENPEHPESRELAGRLYVGLQQYAKAEQAYRELNRLVPDHSDYLAAWADAKVLAEANIYSTETREIVERALLLDPQNRNALWIAALGSESTGDHRSALQYLHALQPLVAGNEAFQAQIAALMDRNQAGLDSTAPVVGPVSDEERTIRVHVRADGEVVSQFVPGDTVFVYARAVEGPKMPLAIARLSVSDLPADILLTEGMAMLPEVTIAAFEELEIVARISRSGEAVARAGDYTSRAVRFSAEDPNEIVSIHIDREVR